MFHQSDIDQFTCCRHHSHHAPLEYTDKEIKTRNILAYSLFSCNLQRIVEANIVLPTDTTTTIKEIYQSSMRVVTLGYIIFFFCGKKRHDNRRFHKQNKEDIQIFLK